MLGIALVLSLGVGVSLGMLGGGGSILTVPILVYVLGMPTKSAVATSLLVVGVTSLVALVPHARAGRVRLDVGASFGAASVLGAALGGRLAAYVPDAFLLVLFATLMLVTAVAMLRGRREHADATPHAPARLRLISVDVAIGMLTGLLGAGGGFVVVPALSLLFGLPMGVAVGTSLIAIAMSSFAALFAYLGQVELDLRLAALVTGFAVLGSVLGGALVRRVQPARLRRAFGLFVLAMGTLMLARQLAQLAALEAPPRALAARGLPWLTLAIATPVAYMLGLARGRRPLSKQTGDNT